MEGFRAERGPRIANLIVRDLLRGRTQWLSAWWEARGIWAKERSNYADTKITEAEYQNLVARLGSPVEN